MITFIFTLAGLAAVIGLAIGAAIGIPLVVYSLPYAAWLG